jgi:uncharacterized protein YuzE
MEYMMYAQIKKHNIMYFVLFAVLINCVYASDIVYPYYATAERAKTIESGYTKIKEGLSARAVVSIMGKPDEIHELNEPKIKNGKIIGFTYWYLIQRIKANSSQIEKNEKLVRVSFDLNGKVTGVDKW